MTMPIEKARTLVQAQLAAEAFLTRSDEDASAVSVEDRFARLRFGNGHASKLTPSEVAAFHGRFEILRQYRNDPLKTDGTGFSGTLLRDRETDARILSFRSTEFIEDAVRDSKSTNELEIKELGWAFGQISEMEAWYRELRADPALLGGRQFHVTGYSLGGHLATAFNLLRIEEEQAGEGANPILSTVTFNGAGVGGLKPGASLRGVLSTFDRIRSMPDATQSAEWMELAGIENSPYGLLLSSRIARIEAEARRVEGLEANFAFGVRPRAGDQANRNYQIAALVAAQDTIPVSGFPFPGGTNWIPTSPRFAPSLIPGMTEIVGSDSGKLGPSFVANSGIHHGERQAVYIEDQPLYRGTYNPLLLGSVDNRPDVNDFADTHSLVLIADSLAVLSLLERLDPAFTLEDGAAILASASSAKARTLVGTQGWAEGDTLERTLDAVAKLVLGPGQVPVLTEYSTVLSGNTWHLDIVREPLQAKVASVAAALDALARTGGLVSRVIPLTGLSSGELAVRAASAGADGEAYRYALHELSPFAVTGFDYSRHAINGRLSLATDGTLEGVSQEWIAARTEFVAAWLRHNQFDGAEASLSRTRFEDASRELELGPNLPGVERTWFGAAGAESITGGFSDNRLFGGAGNDVLAGGAGRDYLEGAAGDDRLSGDDGADVLDGGAGHDTYVVGAAFGGMDTIRDADRDGRIELGGRRLEGGRQVADRTYVDAQGTRYVLLDRGNGLQDLLVGGSARIEDFRSGDLGILLQDPEPPGPPASGGGFFYGDDLYPIGHPQGEDDPWYVAPYAGGSNGADNYRLERGSGVISRGGDDVIVFTGTAAGGVDGGAGNDWIDASATTGVSTSGLDFVGGAGDDRILGSTAADSVFGDNRRVFLAGPHPYAATIDGFFYGLDWDARRHTILTTAEVAFLAESGAYGSIVVELTYQPNSTYLNAALRAMRINTITTEGWHLPGGLPEVLAFVQGEAPTFDDYVEGGGGDDLIYGGHGSDSVYGGPGNDRIRGDYDDLAWLYGATDEALADMASYFGVPGDDVLDGGDGDDDIRDTAGGSDTLIGGAGNDSLYSFDPEGSGSVNVLEGGDGGDVLMAYGVGDSYSLLYGGAGNDTLESNNDLYAAGGVGDDVYRIAGGTIRDEGGNDVLEGLGMQPPAELSPEDVQRMFASADVYDGTSRVSVTRAGDDLVYSAYAELLGEDGNAIVASYDLRIEDWYLGPEHRIENIDGWSADAFESYGSSQFGGVEAVYFEGAEGTDRLFGSSSDDWLAGASGSDLIAGRRGDDVLDGGAGNDHYFYAAGHGHDFVFDAGGLDLLRLAPGIGRGDVGFSYAQGSLRIGIAGGSVSLVGVGPADLDADLPIDRVVFADGQSIDVADAARAIPEPTVEALPPPVAPPVVEVAPVPASREVAAPPVVEIAATAGVSLDAAPLEDATLPPGIARPRDVANAPAARPGTVDATEAPSQPRSEETASVGQPADPLYREIDARLDTLLQVGRASYSERYAEAIREFNRRTDEREPEPTPSGGDLARHNDAMHAWHAANPTFGDADSRETDAAWAPGWSSLGGGASTLDDLVAAGTSPSLANPNSLSRVAGARPLPGLGEGLADLRT